MFRFIQQIFHHNDQCILPEHTINVNNLHYTAVPVMHFPILVTKRLTHAMPTDPFAHRMLHMPITKIGTALLDVVLFEVTSRTSAQLYSMSVQMDSHIIGPVSSLSSAQHRAHDCVDLD